MPKLKQQRHPPKRVSNQEQGRTREYLLPTEVEALLRAAKSLGRHQQRDYTMILLAYRHGLRVSELIGLRWEQIDLTQGHLHVNRLKNGVPSVHPLRGTELRHCASYNGNTQILPMCLFPSATHPYRL